MEESDITTPITIDLGSSSGALGSVIGESVHMHLPRMHSVQGHYSVPSIIGHRADDSVFVANGGECTFKGRGGNNTLIAKRWRHKLTGGTGQDGFELYACSPSDLDVVYVSGAEKCCVYLQWNVG